MGSPKDLIFYGAFLCSSKVCIDVSSPYVQVDCFGLVWLFFCLFVLRLRIKKYTELAMLSTVWSPHLHQFILFSLPSSKSYSLITPSPIKIF